MIIVEGLSKKYILSQGLIASTLVEKLSNLMKKKAVSQDFWALRNISFTLEAGSKLGIIGRNGAGKSTLLKLLSRITEPSSGKIRIKGRVASLLEIGTGFHYELTGRENIFLNGAILGMSQREIRKKFDEIVAFSGIEAFLDIPIKRFSSGMATRLGFAIAAHVEADIMIVDEVLAVGDAQFQEKCLKKLDQLGRSGRTVLFVSHDIGSILTLCNQGLFLERGEIHTFGHIEEATSAYLKSYRSFGFSWGGSLGNDSVRFLGASLTLPEVGREFFYQQETALLKIEYEVFDHVPDLVLTVKVYDHRNVLLAKSDTFDNTEIFPLTTKVGHHELFFPLQTSLFHEGEYIVKVEGRLHEKKISLTREEISLKFPIYKKNKQTRFEHGIEKGGIFLGSGWEVR